MQGGFPVRDHCHFNLLVRIAEQRITPVIFSVAKLMVLPVIFHNLQGYDAHLFIKQPAKLKGGLSCIQSTEEKHISFSKKIKVGEYKSRKTGDQVHSILKFVSSTLLRFFKHLLLILFQIFISRGSLGGATPPIRITLVQARQELLKISRDLPSHSSNGGQQASRDLCRPY